jgi:hypothetical protein
MSDESLAQNDAKIALLEEAILKCEVQLQKAKRQCDALPAAAVAAHYDKHPQVCSPRAPLSLYVTLPCRFKCSSCSV